MKDLAKVIADVKRSRRRAIESVESVTLAQATFKPEGERWSLKEQIEHLVLSELRAIDLVWRAADGVRNGTPEWTGELAYQGLTIDDVIARTWKPKEKAPPETAPSGEGPLAFWIARFEGGQQLLEAAQDALDGLNPSQVIYPHYLSGPLDARQRLEFQRFHIDRHIAQIQEIKNHPDYPSA